MTPITMTDTQRAANTLEAGRIRRYHAVPTVEAQTVGLHSWGVAVLLMYIVGDDISAALLKQALKHDAPEIYTGDSPFTAKRDNPALKRLLTDMELLASEHWVMRDEVLSQREQALLKVADTVEGLIWCRKTELTGPIRERWVGALNIALEKFDQHILPEERQRILDLVNDGWACNL